MSGAQWAEMWPTLAAAAAGFFGGGLVIGDLRYRWAFNEGLREGRRWEREVCHIEHPPRPCTTCALRAGYITAAEIDAKREEILAYDFETPQTPRKAGEP